MLADIDVDALRGYLLDYCGSTFFTVGKPLPAALAPAVRMGLKNN